MPRINTYSDNASIENDDKVLTYDTQAAATKITAFSTIWNWIVTKLHALTSSSAALTPSTDRVLMDKNGTMTRVEPAAVAKYGIETYNGSTIAGSAQTVKSALDTLNSNWVSIDTVSELNSKLSALPSNRTVNVLLQGVVTAVLTDNMASSSGKGYITKISVTSIDYTIMTGAGDFIFIGRYNFSDGTVTSVQKVPTREEITALSSKQGDVIAIGRNYLSAIVASGATRILFFIPYNKNIISPSDGNEINSVTVSTLTLYSNGNVTASQVDNISSIRCWVRKNGFDVEVNFKSKPSAIESFTVIGIDFRGSLTL